MSKRGGISDDDDDDLSFLPTKRRLKPLSDTSESESDDSPGLFNRPAFGGAFGHAGKAAGLNGTKQETRDSEDDSDSDGAAATQGERETGGKSAASERKLQNFAAGLSDDDDVDSDLDSPPSTPTPKKTSVPRASEPSQDDLEDVEEDDETILVRVRKPDGNVFRARLELCRTMQVLYDYMARDVDPARIVLTRKDTVIRFSDTPFLLRLQQDELLEFVLAEEQQEPVEHEKEEEPKAATDDNKVLLTIRTNKGDVHQFRFPKADPFSKLHGIYCERQQLPTASVRFKWDGDALDLSSTPNDMEMEDDDVIDAFVVR